MKALRMRRNINERQHQRQEYERLVSGYSVS